MKGSLQLTRIRRNTSTENAGMTIKESIDAVF
jgi:hypothetical protein